MRGAMRQPAREPARLMVARPRTQISAPTTTLLQIVRVVDMSPLITQGATIIHTPRTGAHHAMPYVRPKAKLKPRPSPATHRPVTRLLSVMPSSPLIPTIHGESAR